MQKIFALTLLFLFSIHSWAQKGDTILYHGTTDTCFATTVRQYDKMLKYFIEDKTEINQLYKIDLHHLGDKGEAPGSPQVALDYFNVVVLGQQLHVKRP